MVNILPRPPSFGERLGASLGGGLSQGMSQATDFAMKMAEKKYELDRRQAFVNAVKNRQTAQNPSFQQQMMGPEGQKESGLGVQKPEEVPYSQRLMQQQDPRAQENRYLDEAEMFALGNEHDLSRVSLERANAERKERESARKLDLAREDRNFKLNTPLYEGIGSARRSLPEKEIAMERIDDAIQSGDIGRFTDWAADRLGLDPLKSTQSQILESAVKTLFLSDLQSIQGGRLNQLIEGNLLKAFQNIGKSPAANQEITETLYAIQDILKKRISIFDDLSEKYDKAGRELPRNADKLIEDQLNPFVKKRISELGKVRNELKQGKVRSNTAVQMRRAQRMTSERPSPIGTKWVLAPDGNIKAVPIEQLRDAQQAGGKIIDE